MATQNQARRYPLTTLEKVRKRLALLIREYKFEEDETLTTERFRALIYAFSTLIGALKSEKEIRDFEARLVAIEEKLSGQKQIDPA